MIDIALADDHVMLRKGVAEMLSRFDNMRVVAQAGNGKELIEQLSLCTKLPDICIIDINMPEMNGYDTAKEIKKRWPKVRILALSMYDTEMNIIKMLRNGAHGYLLKDAEPDELRLAIIAVHENGFYHSDVVTARMLTILHEPDGKTKSDISAKEMQFLKYCSSEMTYKEIAEEMNMSARTIDGYRESLFNKLKITTRTGLAMYAIKAGIVHI